MSYCHRIETTCFYCNCCRTHFQCYGSGVYYSHSKYPGYSAKATTVYCDSCHKYHLRRENCKHCDYIKGFCTECGAKDEDHSFSDLQEDCRLCPECLDEEAPDIVDFLEDENEEEYYYEEEIPKVQQNSE